MRGLIMLKLSWNEQSLNQGVSSEHSVSILASTLVHWKQGK